MTQETDRSRVILFPSPIEQHIRRVIKGEEEPDAVVETSIITRLIEEESENIDANILESLLGATESLSPCAEVGVLISLLSIAIVQMPVNNHDELTAFVVKRLEEEIGVIQ